MAYIKHNGAGRFGLFERCRTPDGRRAEKLLAWLGPYTSLAEALEETPKEIAALEAEVTRYEGMEEWSHDWEEVVAYQKCRRDLVAAQERLQRLQTYVASQPQEQSAL